MILGGGRTILEVWRLPERHRQDGTGTSTNEMVLKVLMLLNLKKDAELLATSLKAGWKHAARDVAEHTEGAGGDGLVRKSRPFLKTTLKASSKRC